MNLYKKTDAKLLSSFASKVTILSWIILTCFLGESQSQTNPKADTSKVKVKVFSKEELEDLQKKTKVDIPGIGLNSKVVKLGLSLGYSALPVKLYDASISPIDNTLKLQKQFPANFLISTALVINPIQGYKVEIDTTKNQIIRAIKMRLHKISFIASVNLVSIGSNTETLFNKKIDGGLGIGYKLSDDFHLALTAEMFSSRQLRDYIINDYQDKPFKIDGKDVTTLDQTDNRLFIDKYTPGICVKFIYIFANKESEKP
jgi:hypothetical protein